MPSLTNKLSQITSLSTTLIKALFFIFLSLFFFIGGIFNTILMFAFISPDHASRDWIYLIFFTLFYMVLGTLSMYKTIKIIKQIKKLVTQPPTQSISVHRGLVKIICSWPVIILVGAFTLFVAYVSISMLLIIAFQNPYFLYRGFQSYIEYFILIQIVSLVILGLAFVTISMIIERLKLSKS